MRKGWIGGNWKMHKDVAEATATATALKSAIAEVGDRVDVVIYPPFPLIPAVTAAVSGSSIQVGGQTLSEHESGAYTGETSGAMLKSLGCTSVLVGHSERRHVYGESDELVEKKLQRALASDLDVVLCVGETLAQREQHQTQDVIARQIHAGFANVSEADTPRITVAYEPVWAIGTGQVATPDQAVEVHQLIRGLLGQQIGADYARAVRIHYGGSVKVDNIETLVGHEDIDGTLVGGASLDAESFGELVKRTATAKTTA